MDEIELGEYVADYVYHRRDLEGEYDPFNMNSNGHIPTAFIQDPKKAAEFAASHDTQHDVKTTVTDIDRDSSERHSRGDLHAHDSGLRARSRSRGRFDAGREEVEMSEMDMRHGRAGQ
jgi:Amt family ammonium transporter